MQLLASSALAYIAITAYQSLARMRRDVRGIIAVQAALHRGILRTSFLALPVGVRRELA